MDMVDPISTFKSRKSCSSFFTDFTKTICRRCWYFLVAKGLDHAGVFSYIEERYGESRMFGAFKTTYLDGLPTKL